MFSAFSSSAPASAVAAPPAQWYYYTQNDPRGIADGWYVYDSTGNMSVEQTYQLAVSAPNGLQQKYLLPMASSGYQYELDFQRMVQRNTTSGKERPIYRTTNGLLPPAGPPLAVPAAALVNNIQHPAASAPTASAAAATSRRSRRWLNSGACVSTRYSSSLSYTAPESLHSVDVDESKVFQDIAPPQTKRRSKRNKDAEQSNAQKDEDDCAICLDALWDGSILSNNRVVALKSCRHRFHYQCIHEALTKGCGGKCPLCSKPIDEHECGTAKTSKGKCPSATMDVSNQPGVSCSGYEGYDMLQIDYHIPSGIQKKYHPAPNLSFTGASRTAYLPNNVEGRDLLNRMEYAFMHGLSFMVGTSLTTGQANTVTWASIHHKTSYHRGTYGFPDNSYFQRANDELDALGVPDAAGCRKWLLSKCPGYI